jgi:MraZ protein
MYFGETHSAVDDKGRLAVPVQFRRIMQVLDHDTWFITRGYDNALLLYPKERWDRLLKEELPGPSLDPLVMDFRRFFLGGAAKAKLDGQGRLLVPQYLRDYASIEREGVLHGLEDHLQLWSNTGWRTFSERQLPDYKNMASALFGNCGSGVAQRSEEKDHAEN